MRLTATTFCGIHVTRKEVWRMLINFSFSNFKSYRDEQRFSMQRPSNAQRH